MTGEENDSILLRGRRIIVHFYNDILLQYQMKNLYTQKTCFQTSNAM